FLSIKYIKEKRTKHDTIIKAYINLEELLIFVLTNSKNIWLFLKARTEINKVNAEAIAKDTIFFMLLSYTERDLINKNRFTKPKIETTRKPVLIY
ncbi:hypothetical protein Q604_UNBC17074G0001, partial [human gut metagenome]